MTPRGRHHRGYTLIELLAYMVVSAVVLNICAVTFVQTTRLATLSTKSAVRQQAVLQFSRDFTRTVHAASRVLPNAGSALTGENQLVLDTPDGVVAIGMAGPSPAIWKLEQADGAWRIAGITTYPIKATVAFAFDTPDTANARRVTMKIAGAPRKDPTDTANGRTLVAALRVNGGAP